MAQRVLVTLVDDVMTLLVALVAALALVVKQGYPVQHSATLWQQQGVLDAWVDDHDDAVVAQPRVLVQLQLLVDSSHHRLPCLESLQGLGQVLEALDALLGALWVL